MILPLTPHIANEILDLHKCKTKNKWPPIKNNYIEDIKFAIQVNGKTRDIITVKKDADQNFVEKMISKESKAEKFIKDKNLKLYLLRINNKRIIK